MRPKRRARDHKEWIDRCMARNLPDATRKHVMTKYGDDCGQAYSMPIVFTGLTPDQTKATFELENGGVAIVPYPKYLRDGETQKNRRDRAVIEPGQINNETQTHRDPTTGN